MFGCGGEDSLEHYSLCAVVKGLRSSSGQYGPGVPANLFCRETFFLIRKGLDDQLKLRVAVALHAVSRAIQSWKIENGPMDMIFAKDVLRNHYFTSNSRPGKNDVA